MWKERKKLQKIENKQSFSNEKSIFIVFKGLSHRFIGVSTPPPTLKNTTLLLLCYPPLDLQIVQAPFPLFRQSPLLYRFSVNSPPKRHIFQWTHKIWKFSSLTPSYLLKVTKFLVKISQFKFLVITEKNISVYKLFFALNISDFIFFFFVKLQPHSPSPLLKKLPSLQVIVLSSLPFWKFGRRFNPPSRKEGCALYIIWGKNKK